ncbi:DUF5302 domain-containing protein [Tessaracoccus sp. MC1756]|uniref:DUF5302 domain-containing protein n=1 Tax=Tessaracoccus sp. MC1756 TaxID=2760311 RepID=UPI0016044A0C|nr:DUF5302 domain-containing protein [Tessaracoccus sp. MC1756]MBB1508796.1 DUF5302 domain-containing protein [Tessaracoccus sp. MC1756]
MSDAEQTDAPLDPKEAMRQALERKKQAEHLSANAGTHGERKQGGQAHGPAVGRREFRRKSGG